MSVTEAAPFFSENTTKNLPNDRKVAPCAKNHTAIRRQLFVSSSHFISAMCFGMTYGFTGTLLPQIKDFVDIETGSWLVGTVVLTMPLGMISSSYMMRYYGRKLCQISLNVFWILGWLCMSFCSPNIWTLLTGCLIVGFSTGMNASVCTLYVIEVCEPRLRGLFMGFIGTSVAVGILFSHLLGILFFWRIALGLSSLIPTVAFVLSISAVESPMWLILRGQTKKAEENFRWLRGNSPECESELKKLLNSRVENTRKDLQSLLRNIFSVNFFKSFITMVIMFTVQQGSGFNIIVFYTVHILQNMSNNLNVYSCTIIIDLLRIVVTIAACFVMKSFNRRTLFFLSSFGTFVALSGIIIITKYSFSTTALIISLIIYIISMYMGLSQITWMMNAEIYPTTTRDIGSGLSGIYSCFATFGVVKISPVIISDLGLPLVFSIYALIVLIGCVILYFIMPETNNKILQQTENNISNERDTGLIDGPPDTNERISDC